MFNLNDMNKLSIMPSFSLPPFELPHIPTVPSLPYITHLTEDIYDGMRKGLSDAADDLSNLENKILSPIKNNVFDAVGDNVLKSSFAVGSISLPIVIGGLVILFIVVKVL